MLKAARHFGVRQPLSMVRERYAFYSATFPSPLGNVSNCFFVSDTADPPRVDGVLIPEKDYDARAVIELDFSVCTPHVATSIICKFDIFLVMENIKVTVGNCQVFEPKSRDSAILRFEFENLVKFTVTNFAILDFGCFRHSLVLLSKIEGFWTSPVSKSADTKPYWRFGWPMATSQHSHGKWLPRIHRIFLP